MAENVSYSHIVDKLRRTFASRKTLSIDYRKQQLIQLKKLLEENENDLAQAIYLDIRRPKAEAVCFEVLFCLNDIKTALANLNDWAKPQKVKKHLLQVLDGAYIHKDPLGVVAIIAPWNYPLLLVLSPFVGAIAAGNCVVLKPSEVSVHTSYILNSLIPKYMDREAFHVITGGIPETTALLQERLDHILYTGSPHVAKVVMEAASKYLTPVTLELGGKCPVIVDSDANVAIAGRRIAWGKFMSCGQTCLAPDYILCHASLKDRLIEEIKKATKEYYGVDPQQSPDYSRIIGEKHFDRLVSLLEGATIVYGGRHDRSDLYIDPTIIDNVKPTDKVMELEIFGPILPILAVADAQEAIDFINEREKPLAVYIFSENKRRVKEVLEFTSSGGVTINDVVLHLALDTLPFGGVGNSGMGRYHGKYTFDTFTHEKAVLQRGSTFESLLWMRYPPYDEQKFKWSRLMSTKHTLPSFEFLPYLAVLVVGVIMGFLLKNVL